MFWIFAGVILAADRVLKNYIDAHFLLHESQPLIDGLISLLYVQNKGAAFSMLSGQRWFLLAVALVTVGGILYYRYRFKPQKQMNMALGCIVGGAVGNMIDRFLYGYVIDYVSIGWWPVFNLADVAIVCGGAWLFLLILLSKEEKE